MPARRAEKPGPATAVLEAPVKARASVPVAGTDAARKLTLLDVAQALGVSRTTISNAFNRPDKLSAALRDEVIRKSRELGYFGPDPAARAMRRTGVHEVAVIFHHDLVHSLSDPPSVEFLRGVAHELDSRHISLQLIPRMGRRLDLAAAFQTTADALIVYAEVESELATEVQALRKPVVLVDAHLPGVTTVANRDREGAEKAMAHALAARPDRVVVPLRGATLHDAGHALFDRLVATGAVSDPDRLLARADEERPEDLVGMGDRAFLLHYRSDAVAELAVALSTSAAPVSRELGESDETQEARIVLFVVAPPRQAPCSASDDRDTRQAGRTGTRATHKEKRAQTEWSAPVSLRF